MDTSIHQDNENLINKPSTDQTARSVWQAPTFTRIEIKNTLIPGKTGYAQDGSSLPTPLP